jgi:hypothetical protein
MLVSNHRYERDLRIFSLAVRMLGYAARTGNICRFTGLSARRVRKLEKVRRRDGPRRTKRHRGPPPSQPTAILSSPSLRSEAGALSGLCRFLGVIPAAPMKNARKRIACLERGEELIDAVDLFQFLVPHARISLDQLVLLVTSLADGQAWSLGCCPGCRSVFVFDRLALRRGGRCEACQEDQVRLRQLLELKLHGMAPDSIAPEPVGLQLSLFDPDE